MKKSSYLYELNLPEEIADLRGRVPDVMSTEAVKARFLITKEELPREITVIDPIDSADYPASLAYEVFVAPNGNDDADGTVDAPLLTLAEAVRRVAGREGATVTLRGGKYALKDTVTLTNAHSGREGAPLILRAYPGERVTFTGNTPISTERERWHPVDPATDPVAARLPLAVRDRVICTNLSEHGLTPSDIPDIRPKNEGPPSLFVNGEEYTLARYPNKDATIFDLLFFTAIYDAGTCTVRDGSNFYWAWVERANREFGGDLFHEVGWQIRLLNCKDNYENAVGRYRPDPTADERAAFILSWVNTGNIWLYGSLYSGYEFGNYNLADRLEGKDFSHYAEEDREERTPLLGAFMPDENGPYTYRGERGYFSLKSKHYNHWGCGPSGNSPAGVNTYYLYNAIEALDEPGEWFLDRETGILYLYPKDESFFGSEMSFSSKKEFTALQLSGLSHAVIDGLTVDGTAEAGILLDGCFDVVLQHCKVTNTKKENLLVKNCRRTAVIYSDFSRAGTVLARYLDKEAHLAQRPTMNLLQNCFFHDPKPMRQHAMVFAGCRSVVSHNYFRNTCMDNSAASECIFEYNRFEGGSGDVSDGGMYYASGWLVKSNHIRYNLFHLFNNTHQAMYFDTMCGGNYAYGNIVSTLGSRANFHKGWYSSTGLGNLCSGNVFILRDGWEVGRANRYGADEDDGELLPGDNLSYSAGFYFYFDNDHAAPEKRAYKLVDPARRLPITPDYGPDARDTVLHQNEGGHWWEGMKADELKNYLGKGYFATRRSDPAFMNYLFGTAIVLDATKNSDYHVRYFYLPARPVGRSFTSSAAPAGTPLTIPPYCYLDEGYRRVRVPARCVTVPESGEITLTYEEIAAMERERRTTAYNVIENNLLLGASPLCDEKMNVLADIDPLFMIADSLGSEWYEDTDGVWKRRGAHGYEKTTVERKNYIVAKFSHVAPGAREGDYTLDPERIPELAGTVDADVLSEILSLSADRCGPTYGFDYASLGSVRNKK